MEDAQHLLFQILKERIPNGFSMVDEVSDLLSVSTDSAYRRIRGQTVLSLEETRKICDKYSISIDSLLGSKPNSVTFRYRAIKPGTFDFRQYLEKILTDITLIKKFDQKKIIYTAKDIPLFYHFEFMELAAFKIFFWLKTFMQFPEYAEKKFSIENPDNELMSLGQEILETYVGIPSIEIWNDESIFSALRQIEFYHDSGLFNEADIGMILCDRLLDLVHHIKNQADQGKKILRSREVADTDNNYQLYYNELTLVDNTILIETDGRRLVYMTHNLLNNLITANEGFCDETSSIMSNMMNKSNLISSASAKLRNVFFLRMEEKIIQLRTKVSNN